MYAYHSRLSLSRFQVDEVIPNRQMRDALKAFYEDVKHARDDASVDESVVSTHESHADGAQVLYIHVCVLMYICLYIYIYAYVCIYIYMYVCMYMCV